MATQQKMKMVSDVQWTLALAILFFKVFIISGSPPSPAIAYSNLEYSIETTITPVFSTLGKQFRVVTNDTVVLPCEVVNPGNYVLAWKKGIAILTAGGTKVTPDKRIRLVDGYNLEIRDIQTKDAGNYVCHIATMEPREITHTVEILVPPRMSYGKELREVDVKKGTSTTLDCKADGNPVPKVTWTRVNNILPSGEKSIESPTLLIEQANRHHAGIYKCTANNGVGSPASSEVNVKVLFPPEIELERAWVHSGEGYEAQLVCIVDAQPTAEVIWYKETLKLDTTERRIMETRGRRHTLVIRKVLFTDFGNYSCVAENSMGKTRQYLELSGRPNPAIFKSHPTGRYKDNYNITWAVNSYTPIEEFKLLFRKVPVHNDNVNYQYQHSKRPTRRQDNDTFGSQLSNQWARSDIWNDVVVPNSPTEQFTQQMSYLIRGLEPGTQYEAKVMAKNRFGWNQMSESFKFQTTSDYVQADPDNELSVFPGLSFFSDAEKTLGVTSLGVSSAPLSTTLLGCALAVTLSLILM
uniref:Lachesin n=1 Tax=Cacopsylla melanoneura TaxID=428564 RepID=A0A8D8LSB1_9HEMI